MNLIYLLSILSMCKVGLMWVVIAGRREHGRRVDRYQRHPSDCGATQAEKAVLGGGIP